jgi:hypothetical protein
MNIREFEFHTHDLRNLWEWNTSDGLDYHRIWIASCSSGVVAYIIEDLGIFLYFNFF